MYVPQRVRCDHADSFGVVWNVSVSTTVRIVPPTVIPVLRVHSPSVQTGYRITINSVLLFFVYLASSCVVQSRHIYLNFQ
jgi:hypothetical protein